MRAPRISSISMVMCSRGRLIVWLDALDKEYAKSVQCETIIFIDLFRFVILLAAGGWRKTVENGL
jgi:hypothetical protein